MTPDLFLACNLTYLILHALQDSRELTSLGCLLEENSISQYFTVLLMNTIVLAVSQQNANVDVMACVTAGHFSSEV